MKRKYIYLLIALTLILSACGRNGKEVEDTYLKNNNTGIESVEVIDAEKYILKYTANNEENTLQIDGYEDTFEPFTILPELGDVTGDGKTDLLVNIRINGNTLCETLSDTYVYIWKNGGLEESLYIGCDEISVWDERYVYNLGSSISESRELVIDACGSKESGVINDVGTIYLKYIEGEWKKQYEESVVSTESNEEIQDEYEQESVSEILDVERYNIQDANLKKKIQETVELKNGTVIEDIYWIDEEHKCIRVAIQYEQQPEELWFNHLEDYFFFKEGDEIEVLYVDYSTDGSMVREVWAEPDFKAHLEDVNFDGQDDLIIALGIDGVMFGEKHCAYLCTEEGYEYCPSFEYISRYYVDHGNKWIVSTLYEDTGNGREEVEYYYIFRGNKLSVIDEKQTAMLSPTPYKEIIDEYGFENGYSLLSFELKSGSVQEYSEYYEVDAIYSKRIYIPGDLEIGDQVTVVFNELTGERRTLELREDGIYPLEEPKGEPYFMGGYYYNTSDGSSWQLRDDNSDPVDAPIYEGKLYIRKDAAVEEAICFEIESVTKEELNRGRCFNGVYFDEMGYVTRLVYYGD